MKQAIFKASFIKYVCASLSCTALEFVLFYGLLFVLDLGQTLSIWIATIIARSISGLVNYILNRLWSFESKDPKVSTEAGKYTLVFLGKMAAAAGGASFLAGFMPTFFAKMITDITLFFVGYLAQKRWVFAKAGHERKDTNDENPGN